MERFPLIGFAGSPWTLATYMVEGRGSKDFSLIKTLIFDQPETAQLLLENHNGSGHSLSERSGSRGRAGPDGVRHLGRRLEQKRLRTFFPALYGAKSLPG